MKLKKKSPGMTHFLKSFKVSLLAKNKLTNSLRRQDV